MVRKSMLDIVKKPDTRKITSVKEIVDKETGELVLSEKKINVSREPDFIKLYFDEITRIYDLPKTNSRVLVSLLRYVNYENKIYLNGALIKELSKELDMKVQSFRNALSKLSKSEVLYRLDTGVYLINPNIMAKGKWSDIEKLRLKVSYMFSNEGKIIENIEAEIIK
jgi:hypothetical protein